MTRRVLYVAAPLRPTEEEIAAVPERSRLDRAVRPRDALRANLDRAMRWLSWLRRSFPETTFIAPWIAALQSGEDDADPAQREAGLVDACAVIERCDGIVLCGPRISDGMRREMEHGRLAGSIRSMDVVSMLTLGGSPRAFEVYDITRPLISPPHPDAPAAPRGRPFVAWVESLRR